MTWISATCTNTACPENGVPKVGEVAEVPTEVVCGNCGQPCTIEADVPPPPPSDTPTLEERVAALEEFNALLTTALSSIFNPADPADGATFAAAMGLIPTKAKK